MITLDTNIYVYSFDQRDRVKQGVAQRIIARLREVQSPAALQLVGELQNVLRRKLKAPSAYSAAAALQVLQHHTMYGYSKAAVGLALHHAAHGRLSYWDALMLTSAAEAGCIVMISEDMQHGATMFGLEIVNPFAADGVSPRAAELLDLV